MSTSAFVITYRDGDGTQRTGTIRADNNAAALDYAFSWRDGLVGFDYSWQLWVLYPVAIESVAAEVDSAEDSTRVESEPAQPYAAPQAGPLPGINYPRAVTQGFTTARAWEDDVIAKATAILDARCAREGEVLRDPGMAGRLAKLQLQAHEREVFLVMFLDTAHRLIATEALFLGTIGGTEVHPREVIKAALRHNASAVILAHNHPSGNGEPSAADRAVTARIKQSAALVDVRVLDHFVIGTGEPVSMAARGWV